MSRRDKLLAKIKNNPRAVRFEELTKLLEWYGYELARIRGSHHLFLRGADRVLIARQIPHMDPGAVEEVLDHIAEIEAEE